MAWWVDEQEMESNGEKEEEKRKEQELKKVATDKKRGWKEEGMRQIKRNQDILFI